MTVTGGNWVGKWRAIGFKWVKARLATESPTTHRTVPFSLVISLLELVILQRLRSPVSEEGMCLYPRRVPLIVLASR